jgi:hypothetical protein
MQRLKDYGRFLLWWSGLGYIALWATTLVTLHHGATLFGRSGLCRPDAAQVLFYWVCDAGSGLALLAAIANVALTITVWAPVFIAAATVLPEALALALPIIAAHVIGLPAALLVMIRAMLALFALVRRGWRRLLAARAARPLSRRT